MLQAVKTATSQFQNWPASILVLVLAGLVTLAAGLAWRPSLPRTAPKLLREGYPILGMVRFFSARSTFFRDGVAATVSGNFSFYFGRHQIVGVSSPEARKVFFESKELNMSEGYVPVCLCLLHRRSGEGTE